jgi:hypothetical protein
MREQKFEDYFGRKIAIDASMHIYQFLVRTWSPHGPHQAVGEATPFHI